VVRLLAEELEEQRERVAAARASVERQFNLGAIIYGVTTGFGRMANVVIDAADTATLQRNLVRSHAAGTGPPLPADQVRAAGVLRVNSLAAGHSGIRLETLDLLVDILNEGVTPVVPAFNLPPAAVTSTANGGDPYLPKNGTSTPALTWQDITGSSSTAFAGYQAYTGVPFKGYIQGPGYWGMTFFIWPPDPRPAKDWRRLYFKQDNGTDWGTTVDNSQLFVNRSVSGSGIGYGDPCGNDRINYKAILAWITSTSGTGNVNPFPTQLRSGNVLFYDSIPTDVPASAYDHTQPNSNITDPNQRYVVRAFPLAPHEDRTVTGDYMTDGGSHYTAEYGLTADTPQTAPPSSCP